MAHISLVTFYDTMCMGIRYLSSFLKEHGHTVDLIFFKEYSSRQVPEDANAVQKIYKPGSIYASVYDVNPPSDEEFRHLKDLLLELAPDAVGISTRSFGLPLAKSLAERVLSTLPRTLTLAGGYGPTLQPEEFAKYYDIVCFGEGEQLILDIAQCINAGQGQADIRRLNNAFYLDKAGTLVTNAVSNPLCDLDELPVPDWSGQGHYLIDNDTVTTEGIVFDDWLDVFITRGCFSSCSYCMSGQWSAIYHKYLDGKFPKVRTRSPERVIQEIADAASHRNLKKIRFMDSIFPISKPFLRQLLSLYKKEVGIPFFCNIFPGAHDAESLHMLMDAGMTETVLGLQSGSEYIRKEIFNRNVSGQSLIETAQTLEEGGVHVKYDLIGFNPFDTPATSLETFNFVTKLPSNIPMSVFQLVFFPGSPLYARYSQDKPQGMPEAHHRMWTYAWHLAARGGDDRAFAENIVRENPEKPSQKAIEALREGFFTLTGVDWNASGTTRHQEG
ncbi:MAG: radical SAM protein [Thermodesulfobacteriota bacterium]